MKKKSLKTILFSLILVLFCPFILSACDEVRFEDVPYGATDAVAEDVIRDLNSSGEYMVNRLGLKLKFETINTYTFYNSARTESKVVKDVISTSIGSANDNPTITVVDTTRYVNDKKMSSITNTYVKTIPNSASSAVSYKYSYTGDFSGEETIYDKDRNEYDSNYQTLISFYKSTIFDAKLEEIDSIGQKVFEEQTYYKLSSGVNGLSVVNDRFVEDKTLVENPQLFKILDKEHLDAVENYYYECAQNSSGYITYYAIHYDISSGEREKYLSVSSITKLKEYGDGVSLKMPDDPNEYTANSFMKTMLKSNSYVVYTKTDPNAENNENRVTWAVAKIGNDYSVRQVEYQSNAPFVVTNYYLVYNKENDYSTYIVDEVNKTLTASEFKLDILNFNFTKPLILKGENGEYYQFGDDTTYTNINLQNEDIYSIKTTVVVENRNEEVTLFIDEYGKDYSVLSSIRFITDVSDYVMVA